MASDPKPARIPYAERPEVIREFCKCVRVHAEGTLKHYDGKRLTNATCELHGDNVERSPF